MTKAFGIDISKYNTSADGTKKVNFNTIKNNQEEVVFIVARTGVSWGYKDPQFDYYWEEMTRIQVCRMAYHVPYFGESALSQMDNMFRILGNKVNWEHDKIVLDLEVAGINTRERITAVTRSCLEICKERTGRYPIIYSRATWVDPYLNVSQLPKVDWWLAEYRKPLPYPLYTSEHPGPPRMPKGINSWLIHQTGSRCKSIGAPALYYMDYNRWNGTKEDVYAYFGYADPPPPPPPPPTSLFRAKCFTSSLYKRSGPGTSFPVVGVLLLGDVVDVFEEKDGWFRIEQDGSVWCSGSERYMRRMGNEPPPDDEPVLFRAKCVANALYKRSGPGTTYATIGYITKNTEVNVYEEKNGWFRIGESSDVWVSGNSNYMQRL